ncbi:putative histone deacetylase [Helianthus annuus]|nr:putative histone deacetylase [Helianthus annuus]
MGGEGYYVNVPWSRGGVGDNDYIFAFEHIVLPIGYLCLCILIYYLKLQEGTWYI